VSIVDWEVVSWYPSHWEYAAAFFAFIWEDDWLERVEEVLAVDDIATQHICHTE
jgi:hypothetical protein